MNQLSDVAEIVMGQSPEGGACSNSPVGMPLLNGPTEFGSRHPHPAQWTTDPKRFAHPNDLLFCVRGSTTGRMNWADQDYAIGRGIAALRHKGGAEFQPWLRGVIENQLDELLVAATGSTFPNVSKNQLHCLEIPEHEICEQRKIAAILGALDDKIELNRKMAAILEEMARALYRSWFVDFDPVHAKAAGRGPAHMDAQTAALFPDSFGEDGLPVGWKVGSIGHELEIMDSKRIPLSKTQRLERQGGIPYYGATSVMDYVDSHLFDEVLLLVGEDGSVENKEGKPFTQYIWGKSWVNNHAHVLKGKRFSVEQLKCIFDATEISPFITGAVQLKLNQGNMKNIPHIFASEAVHAKFDEVIAPWFKRLRLLSDENQTLAALRDTLLPRLMSGELRVGEAKKQVEAVA